MNAIQQAAQERLDAILAAPPTGALARLEHGRRVIAPSLDELHAHEDALRCDGVIAAVERMRYRRRPDANAAVDAMREQTRNQMLRILGDDRPRKSRDPLRARADRVAQEFELERALSDNPRGRGR